jgi:hypothetical protein
MIDSLMGKILKAGAAEGIRTPDPRITNAVLYQLSYRGTPLRLLEIISSASPR